jgi:DNA-binding SARP family transcriptional activator
VLFACLVDERRRVSREELEAVLWEDVLPEAADAALSALLSKLRRVVSLDGRSVVRVVLPEDAWVDVHVAREALHRAETAVARRDWEAAWGPARVAQHVGQRPFLPGETGAWVDARRRAHLALLVRALELVGVAALEIGGGELATAERAARSLVELAPLRESGIRLLMSVLARTGNRAEALLAYDGLRVRLREELGIAPSPETQEVHRVLLA